MYMDVSLHGDSTSTYIHTQLISRSTCHRVLHIYCICHSVASIPYTNSNQIIDDWVVYALLHG